MRRAPIVALTVLLAIGPAAGVAYEPPGVLTGAIAHIARAGVVRIGYRADAAPFSFVSRAGVPGGYSIDLCREIVSAIRDAAGGRPLGVEYVRVTAADRIDRVAARSLDLECGSTTVTPERRARVGFSPAIFISGTKIAVPAGSRVRSLADVAHGRVAVVGGTTNEAVIREMAAQRGVASAVVAADDLAQAFALLDAGGVDAVAGDHILLLGQMVASGRRASYAIVGPFMSFDRYAIAYPPGDDALAALVDARMRELAASGELRRTYNKWFVRTLPNGERLGLPMGVELRRSFEILGQPSE